MADSDAAIDRVKSARTTRHVRGTTLSAGLLLSSALVATTPQAAAQDATWNLNGTGNFNTSTNWSANSVPTGTAFFDASNQNNVSFSGVTSMGGWTFNAGASNYTFATTGTQNLTFTGAGIVINGGSVSINNNADIGFIGSSTAGVSSQQHGGQRHYQQ